jgi:hypothetical protein
MKAKILSECPIGRWKRGEIGEVLENNFDKYDYFIELESIGSIKRFVYFYEDEVELLEEANNE